ncbi:MAG: LysR family transcriptional regulator [Oscillospiraceae bacterium]
MDIIKESNVSLLSVAYSTRSVETVSIQRLPVFLSAAEHLNFTRAAEEQCISQTAVSQQIKLLEQELGYALFVRGKRGVSLTPAGEVFYRQCKQLMIRYNDAAAQGKKIALGNATDLRIGYAGAYELWTIVSQIRKYHRQHPEAEIEFQLGSNQSLLGALAEGQLDMAVLSGFGVELGKGLDSRVTLSDPCMVMISASHPLAEKQTIHPRELKGMPIVLNRAQDSQPSAGLIAGMYANMGLRDNKRMYADDFYSIALIINTGIAFSIMPASMADWGSPASFFARCTVSGRRRAHCWSIRAARRTRASGRSCRSSSPSAEPEKEFAPARLCARGISVCASSCQNELQDRPGEYERPGDGRDRIDLPRLPVRLFLRKIVDACAKDHCADDDADDGDCHDDLLQFSKSAEFVITSTEPALADCTSRIMR